MLEHISKIMNEADFNHNDEYYVNEKTMRIYKTVYRGPEKILFKVYNRNMEFVDDALIKSNSIGYRNLIYIGGKDALGNVKVSMLRGKINKLKRRIEHRRSLISDLSKEIFDINVEVEKVREKLEKEVGKNV